MDSVGAFVAAESACANAEKIAAFAIAKNIKFLTSARVIPRTKFVSRNRFIDFCKSPDWKEMQPKAAA